MVQRVAVLFDNFGPYHRARLNAAANRLDLLGVQAKASSSVYLWENTSADVGFQQQTLFETPPKKRLSPGDLAQVLDQKIGPYQPDAVAVSGWSSEIAIVAVNWSAKRGIPTVLMSESNEIDYVRQPIVEWIKRQFVRQCSAALCGGIPHKNYLMRLGLDERAIFVGYDAVDNTYFSERSADLRTTQTMPDLGKGRRIDSRWWGRYFLASGRFVPKKNHLRLIQAYARYHQAAPSGEAWPLVILGDGSMRPQLENLLHELGLQEQVHLPGFRQYDELPTFYAAAGAFVHPSLTEQWGLVVNEAMASGLPVIVSNRCGCASSLIREGVSGYSFEPSDEDQLAGLMSICSSHPGLSTMGQRSSQIISDWGPERFAAGLADAVAHAVRVGSRSVGLSGKLLTMLTARVQDGRSMRDEV